MSDIERTYGGGKKPLASRKPLETPSSGGMSTPLVAEPAIDPLTTPSQTEGETEDEADDLVETPVQSETEREVPAKMDVSRKGSVQSSAESRADAAKAQARRVSLHDLTNRYFRKPVVVFSRIDMFR